MFGVDEAGKGPVLGPMVVAAVAIDDEAILPDGIKDSKRLSKSKRRRLDKELRESEGISVRTTLVTTDQIDNPDTDMNTLTVEAHADVISQLPDNVNEGIVDASDTDEERHARRVAERVDRPIAVTAEHGADDEHAIVGAASIIAKVKRDKIIEELNTEFDYDIGSGYPSDQTTRSFLERYVEDHGELPPGTRHSWSTAEDILSQS